VTHGLDTEDTPVGDYKVAQVEITKPDTPRCKYRQVLLVYLLASSQELLL
jgi:hypothetical protein